MRSHDQPDDVLMSMPTDQALKQSEITAIRVLSDSVAAVVRAVEGMREDLRDTRETVIRFESITSAVAALTGQVEKIATKVDALESDRDKRSGALGLSEWVFKYTPWIITVLSAAAATVIWKGKGG